MNITLLESLKQEITFNGYREDCGIVIPSKMQTESDRNEKFKRMYNRMAPGYDLAETVIGKIRYGNAIRKLRQDLMQEPEWKNHASALYVSIGTGKNLDYIPSRINKETLNITGLDMSKGMLEQCRNKYSGELNLNLVLGNAEELPFKDNSFDIVFHVGGINFFDDKRAAILEMIRVAKPGTKIMIADETQDYVASRYKKSALTSQWFKDENFDLGELLNCVPANMEEQEVKLLWDKKFYSLTFRKP